MTDSTLDLNLQELTRATTAVRMEAAAQTDSSRTTSVHRFFHLLLLECAERMTPQDFRHAIEIAREQLRKPL